MFCVLSHASESVTEAKVPSRCECRPFRDFTKDPFVPKTCMFVTVDKWYLMSSSPVEFMKNSPAVFVLRITHLEVYVQNMK